MKTIGLNGDCQAHTESISLASQVFFTLAFQPLDLPFLITCSDSVDIFSSRPGTAAPDLGMPTASS